MAWPVARGTEDFGTARHGGEMARGFLARHGTARHWHGTPVARHEHGTAWNGRTWHGTAASRHGTVEHGTGGV